jgi:hypothetical protein
MQVCHHCDRPPCVNPQHLFLGTASENMVDMYRKGRGRGSRRRAGEAVTRAVSLVLAACCLAAGMFAALVGLFAGIGGDL